MNDQLDFYNKNKINPVEIKSDKKFFNLHHHQRRNLYENHLKIPISWFQNKDFLEFGPNSGDNALITCMWGGNGILVEPHSFVHTQIQQLFEKYELEHNLQEIYSETLEIFESNRTFDLVIAEGFLHAISNRIEMLMKLFRFSHDKVIITYSNCYGFFFESLKRFVFRKAIQMKNIDEKNWSLLLDLAEDIFRNAFEKLKTARTFESWVKDVLLNPCITSESLNDLPDFLEKLPPNWKYYSGSPAWDLSFLYCWYKDIKEENIMEYYLQSIPFFITGKHEDSFSSIEVAKIKSLTELMLDFSSNINQVEDRISASDLTVFQQKSLIDVKNLFWSFQTSNIDYTLDFYKDSCISDFWGMPHHYVCFSLR
ncbi:MAG: hypothetical protein CMJ78_01110 [Planctomycetaceae bacterium]|nr:hypothetical protein [Planctomycetaceae bacterium]